MYLRMLKKDLTDKKGLNITLFIFMILASVLIVVSAQLLYTGIVMSDKTYEMCNTSDINILSNYSISDKEENRDYIRKWFENVSEYDSMSIFETAILSKTQMEYVVSKDKKKELCSQALMFSALRKDKNIPYNMDDKLLTIPNGCVVLPQMLINKTEARVGDKIHITTQLGNIYEFTISDFYKSPSSVFNGMMLFSNDDFSAIADEFPLKYDMYVISMKDKEGDYTDIVGRFVTDFKEQGNQNFSIGQNKEIYKTDDGVISLIISLVMSIIGVFMIFMIFVTVHFSLKSAVKREEKEIGIMKAIGVYSFSYRMLFAIKYMTFAVFGGIIGMFIAMPLGNMMIDRFMINIILPEWSVRIVISVSVVLLMILIMVAFVFYSLRCMNKISVIDTIHGENKGERFKKIPGLFLHKKKFINIPLFLALSDISGRIKRYVYLIFTYVVGICIVFLVIQVRDSICSMDYMRKYLQYNALDFDMKISDSYFSKLYKKEGSIDGVYRSINDKFAENNIPAKVEYFNSNIATVIYKERKLTCNIKFGEPDPAEVEYVKGGKSPKLYNEVAMAYLSSQQVGISLGDIITIEYDKYNGDRTSYSKVEEEFVVTAFYEAQCVGIPGIIMGEEFDGAVSDGYTMFKHKLDCSQKDYWEYYDKMDSIFTDDEIKFIPKEEAINKYMGVYNVMFDLLLIVITSIVIFVSVMITILYESVFIEEEISDVAVLKSMGFDRMPIKLWHISRMIVLALIAYLLAVVLTVTLGNHLLGRLISSVIYVYDFQVIVRFFSNFVVVPICVVTFIVLSIIPCLKSVNKVQIWRIRNE